MQEYWGSPTTLKMMTVQQQIVEVKDIVHEQIRTELLRAKLCSNVR